MLRKFFSSCQHCHCCDKVANDEPTNGLKILRRKATVIDLNAELTAVTNSSVLSRLKLILEKVDAGQLAEIPPESLKKNIQYAVSLIQGGVDVEDDRHDVDSRDSAEELALALEETDQFQIEPLKLKQDSKSKKQDESSDHELSEVDEEIIPEEIKAWLAATFTARNLPHRRKSTERPRFRSVANAIRVGLFVDRFYRQLSSNTLQIPPEVVNSLKEISSWHFDIYNLQEKSNNHCLKYVVKDLFSRYGIYAKFRLNLEKLDNFLAAVEYGYTKLKNPYHNDIHAADVTQTLHFFIGSTGIVNILSDLEIFALLFAAMIHDFEHTGRTNNFHVNVGTDLALMYNDHSVLENHHSSAAFRLLKEDDKNFMSHLKREEFREFRTIVIETVLATDMSLHFSQVKNIKSLIRTESTPGSTSNPKTTLAAMSLILHAADIGHPGKPWKIHKRLTDSIIEEFFMQGDEEARLGLPFSPLCDRNSVLVPDSQISFIEFIVEPTMSVLGDLIDFLLKPADENVSLATLKGSPEAKTKKNLKHGGARRAESDNQIKSDARTLSDGGRTSSFPLAPSPGPKVKPWINHLQENKAKWKMIAAGQESLAEKIVLNEVQPAAVPEKT